MINTGSFTALASVQLLSNSSYAFYFPPLPKKLADVNDTDITGAIRLGCETMSKVFNADDNNVPFFGSSIGKQTGLFFSDNHSEAHIPGRHLNALLNAENVLNIKITEGVIEKHASAAFLSYSVVPLPLNRAKPGEKPSRFLPHNLREGFHALYALAQYRNSAKARKIAEESIDFIFQNWDATNGWNKRNLEENYKITLHEWTGPFITGIARAIGPLVKYYKATSYYKALQLAIVIKEKAIEDYFTPSGNFDINKFGTHTHSTTCTMSSLAQLADVTADMNLLNRVKAFYDNGLKEISNEIGWSVENCNPHASVDRGEANNTGDILETALILGKWGYSEYYQHAERILRAHLLPSQLRDISFIKDPDNPEGKDGRRNVANRHKGAFGFPAPYGHKPFKEEDISFNMDIVGGAVGSLCEAFRHIYTASPAGHKVNLLFDYETEAIKISSPYTSKSLNVVIKKPVPLFIRIPAWVDASKISIADNISFHITNSYLFIPSPPVNKAITIPFALAEQSITLNYGSRKIKAILKGDRVKAMENFGTSLNYFDPT